MRVDLRPGVRRLFRLPPLARTTSRDEVDEELWSLIESRTEFLVARGMSSSDARAESIRRVGAHPETARRQLHRYAQGRQRRMHIREQLEAIAQDIRYAARGLARRPSFTMVAVLTLAVGIGATTAIFSAVNALVLRPLPYAKPDELMKVSLVTPDNGTKKGTDDMVWSYPKFTAFRDRQNIFSELSLYVQQQVTVTADPVELIRMEYVGATYLRTLGLTPTLGPDFDRTVDAHPGAAPEVMLSYDFWVRRYNADPAIIGRTIDLDRAPYTVTGIGPSGFEGLTGQAMVFVPITTRPAANDLAEVQSHEFGLVARRRSGVSVAEAASVVNVLGKRINQALAQGSPGWSAKARPLDDARLAPTIKRSIFVLFGAVTFVLLIACVNVANLLLGRASMRRREIAVRLAIGAARARLVRLLLTESLLLAVLGGIASVAVAWVGVHALSTVNPAVALTGQRGGSGLGVVGFSALRLDWEALLFTLGIAIVVGVLFGLAPALTASQASLSDALKGGGHGAAFAHGGRPSVGRRALVVAEVAFAIVLLAGSGLMIRSLARLLATDAGFDGRHVLTLRLTISDFGDVRDSLPGFYTQLIDRVKAVPGVADASLAACAPLAGGCNGTIISFLDRPTDLAKSPGVGVNWASPTWFATMGIPVERGRAFTTADRLGSAKVVIISETAARRFWPGEDPIGKRVAIFQGGFDTGAEVVGIVGDIRQRADSAAKPDVYLPYLQSPRPGMMIFVRAAGDPAALESSVRKAIHEVAPQYPIYDIQPMNSREASATAPTRFSTVLLGLFALTALALAAIGIYGVMALAVTARFREMGIRIALGADRGRLQRLVVGESLGLVMIGAVIGLAGAVACTRVLKSLLFDLSPTDPPTYAAIILIVAVAAIAASWIPARRAARVDPVQALRAE